MLINRGGNDTYRAERISLGLAQIRSNALLIDIGGDDLYDFAAGATGMGAATWRPDYVTPKRTYAYNTYAQSLGAFIDIGGDDEYRARTADDARAPHPLAGNDRTWLQPAPDDSTYGASNFGVGIDVEEGVIPEFDRWR